jgi:outer membrane protein OmpA-like peptidoglycan-associated protein
MNNQPGKWLSITKDGNFQPELIADLPENFTLEFDVVNRYRASNILSYSFSVYNTDNARKDISNDYLSNAFVFHWAGCNGSAGYKIKEQGEEIGKNENLTAKGLTCNGESFEMPAVARISIWRQKSRLRIYVNEEKVVDLPKALNSSIKYNAFRLGSGYMNYANGRENDDLFLVGNLKFAVGAPDTRNKLITEGKFSTTGILFDFQKATVKPESYGVIKEIANALKENPGVRINITGHTSNDGDASANLALSKQRAAAVKQVLTNEFGIDAARMETDGRGGSEPVDKTGTAAGKANNRRVEFIKL